MGRATLLALQILVAVVSIALWHVLTRYPVCGLSYFGAEKDCATILPPFFFSTPLDVASRIVRWFVEGTIWKHLWITLIEAMPSPNQSAKIGASTTRGSALSIFT